MGIKYRLRFVTIIIVLFLFFGVLGKLYYLEFLVGDELRSQSLNKRLFTIELKAQRGLIYDRNNNLIVSNQSGKTAYIVPLEYQKSIENNEELADSDAQTLSEILNIDYLKIKENLLRKNSWYRVLKRNITKEEEIKLENLKLKGLGFENISLRKYPQQSLLSNIIGFTSIDNQGLEGLEYHYDNVLKGENGKIIIEKDRYGNILSKKHEYIEAKEGKSLVLTIDSQIQYYAEEELQKLIQQSQPDAACIIVQDITNGEILAMATIPTYHPEEKGNTDESNRKNMGVQFNYEPGSVFKLITYSAALENKTINANSTFNDPGSIIVSNHRIKNWNYPNKNGIIDINKALGQSSNVVPVQLIQEMGADNYYTYLEKFKLGELTNVDLPGEEKGFVRNKKDLYPLDLASTSIGQSIMVTPLQLINSISTIVNGGTMYKPYIVKEIIDSDNNIIETINPTIINENVVSQNTSDIIKEALEYNFINGLARNMLSDKYRLGGKSGTAQKAGESGRYIANQYVSSFAVVGPMSNPKYAVLTVIDNPKGLVYGGTSLAGPISKNLIEKILIYYDIPSDQKPELVNKALKINPPVVESTVNTIENEVFVNENNTEALEE